MSDFKVGSLVCVWAVAVAVTGGVDIIQFPALVRSRVGRTVSLYCQLTAIDSHCYTVAWMKLHRWSNTLAVYKTDGGKESGRKKSCRVDITNPTTEDSGTYYCAVVDQERQERLVMGNGTTVIIESNPSSSVEIALTVHRKNNSLAVLTCLVTGIHPSIGRVFWVLDDGDREESGHSEAIWTNSSSPSVAMVTRNQLAVSLPEVMERTYTCVVHYAHNNTLHRSLSLNDPQRTCYATTSLPRTMAVVSTLLLQMLMVAMAQCFKKLKKINREQEVNRPVVNRRQKGSQNWIKDDQVYDFES
ncbi:uncharacterized protein LOC134435768 [Engraulis encrasicolus]|uniref:uncharacterized protein LOC134435768 n=1 Tax=Engraulis encrasicolus TaxID=184585 RepID=UPI002FD3E18B